MIWLALFGLGCNPPKSSVEDSAQIFRDTASHDTEHPHNDPWPDTDANWTNSVSVVQDGSVLSPGADLELTSAPAGVDHTTTLQLSLTNRSEEVLSLDSSPQAWLSEDGFEWSEPLPDALQPGETTVVSLSFNPVNRETEALLEHTLTLPFQEAPVTFHLVTSVPSPLRLILVGDGGYTLVSDTYGRAFEHEHIPSSTEQTLMDAAWGSGVFIRAIRPGDWFSEGVYEFSPDGVLWQTATVSGSDFPFACDYGFDEFLCVRGYGAYFTHSPDGEVFQHEDTYGNVSTFINDLLYTDGRFVGVGREGTRAIAVGLESFDSSSVVTNSDLGDLNSVAAGNGRIVAVGGSGNYAVSTSEDGGLTWTERSFSHDHLYARFDAVAFNGSYWLATGSNSIDYPVYRSSDAEEWTPVTSGPAGLHVLGAHNGWFLATYDGEVHRSEDGETWSSVHTIPSGMGLSAMAAERWEAP